MSGEIDPTSAAAIVAMVMWLGAALLCLFVAVMMLLGKL